MSIFEPRHDNALLPSSWLSKSTNDGTWLFKYAPHPDREGYVFAATNLETVIFESLTAPSIPSRLTSLSAEQSSQGASQINDKDVHRQAGSALRKLGNIMVPGKGWNECQVKVNEHSFYDRVIRISMGGSKEEVFEWVFNTAELRSPLPLSFISRHLIGPLASIVPLLASGSSSSISGQKSKKSVEAVGSLLSDQRIQRSLKEASEGAQTSEGLKRKIHEISEVEGENEGVEQQTLQSLPSAQKSPVRRDSESIQPEKSGSPARNPTEVEEPNEEEAEEYRSSPERDVISPSPPPSPAKPSPTQRDVSPPRKALKTSKDVVHTTRKTATASPVKQPPPSAPSQSTQKSKKDKEREEEEEMEKRREEMKRKMHAGGGGRLGKRRAGR